MTPAGGMPSRGVPSGCGKRFGRTGALTPSDRGKESAGPASLGRRKLWRSRSALRRPKRCGLLGLVRRPSESKQAVGRARSLAGRRRRHSHGRGQAKRVKKTARLQRAAALALHQRLQELRPLLRRDTLQAHQSREHGLAVRC
jgi:hypothetical protein